jgi:hypothetical protein
MGICQVKFFRSRTRHKEIKSSEEVVFFQVGQKCSDARPPECFLPANQAGNPEE